ncbi:XRE family transcriptional regulator [bacterium]|nr:XRE family transcriptional regulator [bacterium]
MFYILFGRFLSTLCEEKGITFSNLALYTGVSNKKALKWIRGVSLPNSNTMLRLSDIFNVSVEELIAGKRFENENEAADTKTTFYKNHRKLCKKESLLLTLIPFFFYLTFTIACVFRRYDIYDKFGVASVLIGFVGIITSVIYVFVIAKKKRQYPLKTYKYFSEDEKDTFYKKYTFFNMAFTIYVIIAAVLSYLIAYNTEAGISLSIIFVIIYYAGFIMLLYYIWLDTIYGLRKNEEFFNASINKNSLMIQVIPYIKLGYIIQIIFLPFIFAISTDILIDNSQGLSIYGYFIYSLFAVVWFICGIFTLINFYKIKEKADIAIMNRQRY